ncbi:M4 family metallopeptidase [Streptomyces sp. NPDC048270]|uniref:M4 family metallopeptidase n=1 Tax=Streptomyces sp. NPDC048270 TaxID=3154615 RepID=UPI0033D7BB2F
MRLPRYTQSLALAVGGLLVAGAMAQPAVATASGSATASDPGPAPSKVTPTEALRDAKESIAGHPRAVRASAQDTFTSGAVQIDKDGSGHVRLNRQYQGLPVVGGDVIVHSAPDGKLRNTTLSLAAPLSISTKPKVGSATALATAKKLFKGKLASTSVKLAVDALSATPRLVWHVETNGIAPDQSPNELNVLVDAITGEIVHNWNGFHTAEGTGRGYQVGTVGVSTTPISGGYELKDPLRGNGETRDAQNRTVPDTEGIPSGWGKAFTDTDNAWADGMLTNRATAAVDAHYGIQQTWDYFKNVHGRNGIRNDGVGARSFVHWGVNYANAGWSDNDFAMIYGDGQPGSNPFTQLDVAGHEMAHGVTAATANLIYRGESGGLNEATSDIFGTLVEFNTNNAADAPDYLIGEKIDIRGNGTPLRYMDKPSKDGRGSQDCWTTGTKDLDPHYSSGPANHFFYLLAVGSGESSWGNSPTCNGSTVTGIGNAAAGKIWYRALTTYMTSGTTYAQARTATIKAANDLYGATSAQCTAVEKAWSSVSVAATATTCGGTPPPTSDNLLVNPGFESGASAWTTAAGVITNSAGGAPYAGSYYAYLNGYGTTHTDTLSQSVSIPPTAVAPKLSFYLRISTAETGTTVYDTLKAQVVSGTTTTTLATYSNTTPSDYTLRTFDLSAFKGKTVTIKFLGVEDSSLSTSFLIDNTAVTGITAWPVPRSVSAP